MTDTTVEQAWRRYDGAVMTGQESGWNDARIKRADELQKAVVAAVRAQMDGDTRRLVEAATALWLTMGDLASPLDVWVEFVAALEPFKAAPTAEPNEVER